MYDRSEEAWFIPQHPRALASGFLIFIIIGTICYLSVYQSMIFIDGDSPWHLATGDYIRHHGFPDTDPWSFTAGQYRWYNLSWLYDVAISHVAGAVGIEGLLLCIIALTALISALMLAHSLKSGYGFIAAGLAALLLLMACKPALNIRPQYASMLLTAFFYIHLHSFRQRSTAWALAPLPLYMILWVNVHGAFIVAFTLLGAFGLEALIWRRKKDVIAIAAISAACAVATVCNPYGLEIYEGALRTLGSGLGQGYISEWRPASLFKQPLTYVYLLVLLFVPHCFIRSRPADMVLGVFWSLMAIQSYRYLGFQSIIMTPLVAATLHARLAASRVGTWYLAKTVEYTADFSRKRVAGALGLCYVLVLLGLSYTPLRHMVWTQPLLDSKQYPADEIAYIGRSFPGKPVFNHYNYGGLVIFQAGDKLKPMIDGRADTAYPEAVIEEYLNLERFNEGWEATLDKYNIEVALLPKEFKPSYHLVKYAGWMLEYAGPVANVYVKQKPAAQ